MPRQSKPEKKTTGKTTENKGVTKKNQKSTEKEPKVHSKKQQEEESSDSEFSFEEGTDEDSTELSSSGTDEFADGKAQVELTLDEKTHKELKEKVDKDKKALIDIEHSDPRGVIYLGRLPYGLCESQMQTFFSQFGEVTRLKLSRNKKTGRSKHYAFVEFLDPVVAQIVADTMDGHIMFTKMLQCKVIPPEKVHAKMFKGHGERLQIGRLRQKNQQASSQGTGDVEKKLKDIASKEKKKKEALKALGINYDFSAPKPTIEK